MLDELVHNNSFFPPINNTSYGKATGSLIKTLLNNLGSGKKSDNKYSNVNNSGGGVYHSLPPIVPSRETSEGKAMPKAKYIL